MRFLLLALVFCAFAISTVVSGWRSSDVQITHGHRYAYDDLPEDHSIEDFSDSIDEDFGQIRNPSEVEGIPKVDSDGPIAILVKAEEKNWRVRRSQPRHKFAPTAGDELPGDIRIVTGKVQDTTSVPETTITEATLGTTTFLRVRKVPTIFFPICYFIECG